MRRWTARLLMLAMLVPALGPVALARLPQPQTPHCLRQSAKPVMQCHHGMAMTLEQPSPEDSFGALDQCCENHDCCRGLAAPQWARPQSRLLSQRGLPTEKTPAAPDARLSPIAPTDNDSARAPPCS